MAGRDGFFIVPRSSGIYEVYLLFEGVSFNQPKLCPNATWNPVAVTFAGNETVGKQPQTIFVNANNTVYTANFENGTIHVWAEGSTAPTGTILTNYTETRALFVSVTGDIYVDAGIPNKRVDVWRVDSSSSVSSLAVDDRCFSLFIDMNQSLYCSMQYSHKVIKRSLNISDTQVTTVAGAGCAGFQPHLLYYQRGIFVSASFDLYVADTNNHRVQLFRPGQLNATTVAGKEALGTAQLLNPAAVMLDGDGYLFILDCSHYRIVGSGPYGFRCVVGCTNGMGAASNQLSGSWSMAFDSHGNIFVTDTENARVQKFFLVSNTCSK